MTRKLMIFAAAVAALPAAAQQRSVPLIPAPAMLETQRGTLRISAGDTIAVASDDPVATAAGTRLAELVAKMGGPRLVMGDGNRAAIRLVRIAKGSMPEEGYRLSVTRAGVRAEAADDAGLRNAAATLAQLLTPGDQDLKGVTVPHLRIEDRPRFRWRGVMLDVARHFTTIEQVRKVVDTMAQHKLNMLQLHLTDDQGWRMEIKRFPELTRIGAWRKGPSTGGPDDGKRYGGFFTQDELRDLVAYARERGVTIVPEIDMPGHAQAAVASYPEAGVFKDRPVVSPEWGINPYLFGTDDQAWTFITGVLDEVLEVFPSTYIHVGGDEALKHQWQTSPVAQAQMKKLGLKNEEELQSWFVDRLGRYLADRGRRLIGWDEILEGGLPASATVMSWRGEEGAVAAAGLGHDVVLSPGPVMYLDNLQSARGDEPHGRLAVQSLETVYRYDPIPAKLSPDRAHHVLGAQANLWAEYIKTPAQIDHALFPRLDALAELTWSSKEARNWNAFLSRLEPQMARYSRQGVGAADSAFAVDFTPDRPAADLLDRRRATVTLANQAKHGTIRFTRDGSEPTVRSSTYRGPLALAMGDRVRARPFGKDGAPLAATREFALTADALMTRDSAGLDICPGAGIRLRVALHPDTNADAPAYNVNLFDTCWLYHKAPLAQAAKVEVALGRLARHYALRQPQREAVIWRYNPTRYGSVVIRSGGCEGAVVATLPIPDPEASPNRFVLTAPLGTDEREADLCLVTIPSEGGPIYGIERVRLIPQ
ncbi:family 20 glycosylhydrolase [Sphingomonas sp. PL-96]|uniref:beta-N-acetylhexosaminidase n=1 Tax=Sphingomonas sp. PL-96 TaxID=2887201 RepID=UPI001E2A657B|nr:family 20 glycosylhydrolase [Sphingomonas sp. PL-96]MCC2977069.1 family 20 glycosylhydrolase [Sphingomonas sp. PL-96]